MSLVSGQLQLDLLHVIGIYVSISKGVNKFPVDSHMPAPSCRIKQCVRCYIEGTPKYQRFAGRADRKACHLQHKIGKRRDKAVKLLFRWLHFLQGDLEVSGITLGFHGYEHSSTIRIVFRGFDNVFNLVDIFTVPIAPLVSIYRA